MLTPEPDDIQADRLAAIALAEAASTGEVSDLKVLLAGTGTDAGRLAIAAAVMAADLAAAIAENRGLSVAGVLETYRRHVLGQRGPGAYR